MSDVKPEAVFKFRVKAENYHGRWSEYRTSDEPFNPEYQVETLNSEHFSLNTLIVGFILILLLFIMIFKYCT